ncbi:MAG: phosphatidylinositol-specific phospholipase C/glycerophosphodiester phosphodiesterase family protein [Bryobacteraceae bacterium]
MKIIRHRRNTKADLAATHHEYGVEVDIRSYGSDLIIHHDAFTEGERFEDWLTAYAHQTLILNVKEEGLEDRLLVLMKEHGIEDFFFLDQSFPFLVKTARSGERRCAVRVSEFESVETALGLAGMIDWVWVDCFTRFPLSGDDAKRLKASGLRLCLVSPELQGRTDPAEIAAMRLLLAELGIQADAVCTKTPERWN